MVSRPGNPGGGFSESFSSSVCGATEQQQNNTVSQITAEPIINEPLDRVSKRGDDAELYMEITACRLQAPSHCVRTPPPPTKVDFFSRARHGFDKLEERLRRRDPYQFLARSDS